MIDTWAGRIFKETATVMSGCRRMFEVGSSTHPGNVQQEHGDVKAQCVRGHLERKASCSKTQLPEHAQLVFILVHDRGALGVRDNRLFLQCIDGLSGRVGV